jgi:hypothetical protein
MQKIWIFAAAMLGAGTAVAQDKPFICYYDDHADFTKVESAPADTKIGEVAKAGYSGDKVYSYTITARDDTACPNQVPLGTKAAVTAALMKQDSSNCTNDDVSNAEPAVLGGSVTVYRVSSRAKGVNMHLLGAAPDTLYALYVKCGEKLGTIKTDAKGRADRTFNFQPDASSTAFAFEAAPDGAAAGPKFQSVKIPR